MTRTVEAVVLHQAMDLRIGSVEMEGPGPGEVAVAIERGGICGSDLHYYHEGRIGTITVKEPLVLGHEVAGRVTATGQDVTNVRAGDRVALSPSRPCGKCRYCRDGKAIHCLDMRFYGSAMRFPHVQGAFRREIVAHHSQCMRVPDHVGADEAAMCEPFAVCLHAANRAGTLSDRRVLITGCGPIGALTIVAARHFGAGEIVVTDINDMPFPLARKLGADRTINVATDPAAIQEFSRDKGYFDVVFECSGNEKALTGAFDAIKPLGIIVQVGIAGLVTLPINFVVTKELDVRGTFRFDGEFALAAELISSRAVDVRPLISATHPYTDAIAAFELASDRARAMKVQLAFT